MVNPAANRHGKGTLGCLVWVLVLIVVGYVGTQFGRPWFRYRQFQDEMKTVAEFAQTITDSAMRGRIMATADSLELPVAAKRNLRVRRETNPRRLVIESEYADTIRLPFIGEKILTFKPQVQEAL